MAEGVVKKNDSWEFFYLMEEAYENERLKEAGGRKSDIRCEREREREREREQADTLLIQDQIFPHSPGFELKTGMSLGVHVYSYKPCFGPELNWDV